MKKSLNFKLIAGGALVVLIPLLVVGTFSAIKSQNALMDSAKDRATQIAKDVSTTVHLVMQEEVKLVSGLAARDNIIDMAAKFKSGGTEGAKAEIAKVSNDLADVMKKIGKDYEGFLITDANGLIYADGIGGKYKGLAIPDRDYFKDAKASGKPVVGTPVKSKATGNPVVGVSTPLYSHSGEFLGVIAGILKIDFLSEKITSIKIGKTGYAWIVNQKGVVIVHPKKEFVLELDLTTQEGMKEFIAKMMAKQTGADEYVFKGVHKIAGYTPIELTGWGVGVTQDSGEFLGEAHMIRNFILLIGGIFLAITLVAVYFFARSISLPITQIVKDLAEGSNQIATASGEVSTASQSMAEGASEQAAAIEETSSSLEEMSSMTKLNADNAGHANSLMKEAKDVVTRANTSMSSLTKSMEEISTASEATSKIIKTIDEIAFQTNLLALNAAVEAARAGEAGAGFAVVAEEVRNLAIRAADAAKNTAGLIEGTVKKIKEGTDLVNKTNLDFKEVDVSSAKVAQLIGEISAASTEQAEGIGQVNKAVVEMDKVVQHNAANAEELASSSEEMNAQAESMRGRAQDLSIIINGVVVTGGRRKASLRKEDMREEIATEQRKKLPLFRKGKDVKGSNKGKQLRPEEVIPMGDEDFRDF